jgi:hypothetical protein
MVSDTQLGRAKEDSIVVKYSRICLPLLGRPMVNSAPTGSCFRPNGNVALVQGTPQMQSARGQWC